MLKLRWGESGRPVAPEVHKDKGPGLLESIYEWCLTKELELRGYTVRNQRKVVVH